MKIHKIEQQSPEWFELRKGKMTASHAQAIGNNGKGLDSYILSLMSEFYSSGEKEKYSNADTERGNELEPLARGIYELQNMVSVEQVGFIELDEYIGCSPDGLVGDDGGIEIKCLNDLNHFKLVSGKSKIESKHIWQIQMNLLITGRKWWDFVSYNPNYKKSLHVERIYPNDEKFEKLRQGFEKGKSLISEIKKSYL